MTAIECPIVDTKITEANGMRFCVVRRTVFGSEQVCLKI